MCVDIDKLIIVWYNIISPMIGLIKIGERFLMKKSSLKVIKKSNKNMLLKLIHDSEYTSRAELKRTTRLAPTTVSTLVDELIESGLVRETGILDTGKIGRKAVSIEINPGGRYFAGVEIGSEKIIIDIYDLRFNIVFNRESETGTYKEILDFIISSLKDFYNESKIGIYSVVIGVSGIVDPQNNKILLSTVMDIKDENFVCDIKKEFPKIDVILQNTSALIAYAEMEEREVLDLVSVDIGKGVGSGIIIGGEIYTGAGGTAGEFGHVSIDMNGEVCKCGNRGCTEIYTNTDRIRKRAAKILGEDKVSLKRIYDEASGGNEEIIALIEEITQILSFAFVGLINMLAPESIVISGKIKELSEVFLNPLEKAVKDKCSMRQTVLEYSSIEGNAITLGGAEYAFEKMINKDII